MGIHRFFFFLFLAWRLNDLSGKFFLAVRHTADCSRDLENKTIQERPITKQLKKSIEEIRVN